MQTYDTDVNRTYIQTKFTEDKQLKLKRVKEIQFTYILSDEESYQNIYIFYIIQK